MLILFVASGSWAEAATYFVKNGGSDAADGLSDANAWANISEVNSTAFSAGDTVNFRRGSTWTGTTLVIDSNGPSGNPVTYQAYDAGNTPAWLTVRNNIFNSNIGITNQTGFSHTHDRYNMTGGATIGYTLGARESSGGPGFVDAANGDLHL